MKHPFVVLCLAGSLGLGSGCTGSVMEGGAGEGNGSTGGQAGAAGSRGGTAGKSGAGGAAGMGVGIDPGGGGSRGTDAGVGQTVPPPATVGASPLRRLTRIEYGNTIKDLLADTSNITVGFSADTLGPAGFTIGAGVTDVEAVQYQDAAEKLAATATSPANLKTLLPCDPAADESGCADKFISDFGKRAYRRPLLADEQADLKALFTATRKTYDFGNSVRVLLETMLQSPNFLYRGEFGLVSADPKVKLRPLSAYEVASRLSYFFWSSMPDAMLMADADSGALGKPEVLEKHARRLLADDRARTAIEQFGLGWLHLDYGDVQKDTKLYKDFTPQAKASMNAGLTEFLVQYLLKGPGDVAGLFSADYAYADAALAPLYGATVPAASGFQKVTFDPAQGRAGILGSAAFLAKFAGPSTSSPTRRGVMVREQFLCQDIPPPPKDLNPVPPSASATQTTREQVIAHRTDPTCSGCHSLFDPIGLAFESFDAIGKYRATEAGKPIDASGALTNTDVDGTVDGLKDLSGRLARSQTVQACLTNQIFRYALARMETDDTAAVAQLNQSFAAGKFNVRELMVALVKNDAFLYQPGN